MAEAEYFSKLQATVPAVIQSLSAKGIHNRHLEFGGEGAIPERKPTVPTDARSEFLANRAMGDWAEEKFAEALRALPNGYEVSHYGDTDRIAAGHPDFRETYLAGLEATRKFGKRPDLLIFPANSPVSGDFSAHGNPETDRLVKQAIAAVEVRSSKFEALTYMRVRETQRAAGNTSGRPTPSFTVKVEDLIIVYRWLERYRVPETYVQVFFDSIFAINFLDIFRIIAAGKDFKIETPAKSQEKATMMIPITMGTQIGRAIDMPTFEAKTRVTALGRHDAYVVPQGGGFDLDPEKTVSVLAAE